MSAPYSVQLDASSARDLASRGAALLLLDVPPGTAVGIDQHTFVIGPKFRGVKMVPPGPHLLSYAAGGGPGGFSPTTAVFTHARAGQVLAWQWNAAEELLVPVSDDTQLVALHQAVYSFQFDDGLAPYNLPAHSVWRELSLHISPAVIDRVAPVGGNISAASEGQAASALEGVGSTPAEQALEAQIGCGMEVKRRRNIHTTLPVDSDVSEEAAAGVPSSKHAGRCFFTPLPLLIKRSGATPAELTAANMDKSAALEQVLSKRFEGRQEEFLGEAVVAWDKGWWMTMQGHWRVAWLAPTESVPS